jgi:hypothetical protein
MTATIIAPNSICTAKPRFIYNTWLASKIDGFSFMLLVTTLLISVFDRRMAKCTRKLTEALHLANAGIPHCRALAHQ